MLINNSPNNGWIINNELILPINAFVKTEDWLTHVMMTLKSQEIQNWLNCVHTMNQAEHYIEAIIAVLNMKNEWIDLPEELFKI